MDKKQYAFRDSIEDVINWHSMENGSNTPDFILAQFLTDSLAAFDGAVAAREKWYGRDPSGIKHEPATPGQPAAAVPHEHESANPVVGMEYRDKYTGLASRIIGWEAKFIYTSFLAGQTCEGAESQTWDEWREKVRNGRYTILGYEPTPPAQPAQSSADLLRQEAERVGKIPGAAGTGADDLLSGLVWALNVSAAWLDSLQAPERQTRYAKVEDSE